MKNLKNIFTLALIISAVSLQAQFKVDAEKENKSIYPDAIWNTINFELINKADAPIYVSLQGQTNKTFYTVNDKLTNWQEVGKKKGGFIEVPVGSTLSASIGDTAFMNSSKPLVVSIATGWKNDLPATITGFRLYPESGTVYLTYSPSKTPALYPQTGPLKGIGKFTPNFIKEDRTNTGLLKRNNITAKQIDQLAR